MTHGCAEVIVPVGAVQTVAFVEVHHIGNVGEIVAWSRHICVAVFDVYAVLSRDGGILPGAGRHDKATQQIFPFVCRGCLGSQIDVDPSLALVDIRR